MAEVHIIRQDVARALAAHEILPDNPGLLEELRQQIERRDRAMRSLARDDNASVRHIAAMFRCSKTAVRTALAGESE